MSVQSSLRRFRFAPAPVDPLTDAIASFVYAKILSAEWSGNPKYYPREFLRTDHDRSPGVIGEDENVGIKFATDGIGFGGSPAGAGSGVVASEGENGLLFKTAFGTQVLDTGTVLAAASTASVLKVASTATISVGSFVGLVDPDTSLYHARQIRSKTATDLTLDRDLPFTPAEAATLYASATYTHALEGHPYLWFDLEGYDPTAANNWRRYVRGCLLDLELKTDGPLAFNWDAKGLDVGIADGTTQGAPTYVANLPTFSTFATKSTRVWDGTTERKVSGIGFKLGNKINVKPASGAPNGIGGQFVAGYEPLITFTMIHDDGGAAMVAKFMAGTQVDLLLEITQGGPGNGFAIAAPNCELSGLKNTSTNGLDAYTFEARPTASSLTGIAQLAFGVL